MNYNVRLRQDIDRNLWDAFVDASDEAWLWHRYDFQDAMSTWRKRDLSFAVYDPSHSENTSEGLLAVLPLHLTEGKALRLIPWNVLDSFGGPAMQNGLGEKHRQKILAFVRDHLLAVAQQHNAVEINFALPTMAPAYRGERCPPVNPLLYLGCENTLTQSWVVDLREGEDALWSRMEKRAQKIRKAKKNGVQIRQADQSDDLDRYYELHCETYRRTGASPHPKAYFAAIWRDFLAHGYAYIAIAEHEGEIVAAGNFSVYKNAALYWTSASYRRGLKVEANSLIQWTAMQWMVRQNIHWYEVGEAFPNIAEGKLQGLDEFKRSFGGALYPFYRGRIIYQPRIHNIAAIIKAVR